MGLRKIILLRITKAWTHFFVVHLELMCFNKNLTLQNTNTPVQYLTYKINIDSCTTYSIVQNYYLDIVSRHTREFYFWLQYELTSFSCQCFHVWNSKSGPDLRATELKEENYCSPLQVLTKLHNIGENTHILYYITPSVYFPTQCMVALLLYKFSWGRCTEIFVFLNKKKKLNIVCYLIFARTTVLLWMNLN